MMTKLFPLMDIGKMHLNDGRRNRRDRVANSDAVMRERRRVQDHKRIAFFRRSLQRVDKRAFMVRLQKVRLDSRFLRPSRNHLVDVVQRRLPVNLRLPRPQKV